METCKLMKIDCTDFLIRAIIKCYIKSYDIMRYFLGLFTFKYSISTNIHRSKFECSKTPHVLLYLYTKTASNVKLY